ncbi:unnamed protein product [Linum trigynum]|uniref:Uncharacterized protein n=1 Tax=Linum trigynum TaxID=586398 RepID=A0AAV2GEZ5_9ROSI
MHSLISPHRTTQAIPLDATASRVAERDRTKKVGFRRWFSPEICSILRLQEAAVDDGEEAKCKPSLIRWNHLSLFRLEMRGNRLNQFRTTLKLLCPVENILTR